MSTETPNKTPQWSMLAAVSAVLCVTLVTHAWSGVGLAIPGQRPAGANTGNRALMADSGLPEGLVWQTEEEKNYLKLHKCRDGGEAYSAAYLTSKEHVLLQHTAFNLSMVNCEMGSFIMMYSPRKAPDNASVVMSLDVLDYSVVHLSAYERLQRRWSFLGMAAKEGIQPVIFSQAYIRNLSSVLDTKGRELGLGGFNRVSEPRPTGTGPQAAAAPVEVTRPVPLVTTTDAPVEQGRGQEAVAVPKRTRRALAYTGTATTSRPRPTPGRALVADATSLASLHQPDPRLQRTVAIMPFLGFANGAGHSKLNNRFEYLQAYIVVFVKSEKDRHWVAEVSGLPLWRVELLSDLPKHAALPVGSVQATKAKLKSGEWDFDYLYFTESDQILVNRIHTELYDHLDLHPRRMLLPHRLMPYPTEVLKDLYHRKLDKHMAPLHADNSPNHAENSAWEGNSCCLRRDACQGRKAFIHISEDSSTNGKDMDSPYAKHMARKEDRMRQKASVSGKPAPPAPPKADTHANPRDKPSGQVVPIRNIYGLSVPLGNTNFFQETYRACTMSDHKSVCG